MYLAQRLIQNLFHFKFWPSSMIFTVFLLHLLSVCFNVLDSSSLLLCHSQHMPSIIKTTATAFSFWAWRRKNRDTSQLSQPLSFEGFFRSSTQQFLFTYHCQDASMLTPCLQRAREKSSHITVSCSDSEGKIHCRAITVRSATLTITLALKSCGKCSQRSEVWAEAYGHGYRPSEYLSSTENEVNPCFIVLNNDP